MPSNILLADDDPAMRSFISTALKRAGHNVTEAEDGIDALNKLKRNGEFDLLLTDIVMPGIDGVELAKKASKIQPHIKVIFITGFTAMATKHKGEITTNHSKLISKPFHLNDLVKQVEEILQAPTE